MSDRELAELLHYRPSHIRGIETGQSSPCAKTFIASLKKAIDGSDSESQRTILQDLVNDLEILCAEADKIDPRRGTERKLNTPRHRTADVLLGDWTAVWQTSREGREAVVVESVEVSMRKPGRDFQMSNTDDSRWLDADTVFDGSSGVSGSGHFQWQAFCHMRLVDQWIIGDFLSIADVHVDGVLRVRLDNFPEVMVGNWLGVSADSQRTYGLLVCARTEVKALARFAMEQERHPELPHAPSSILQ